MDKRKDSINRIVIGDVGSGKTVIAFIITALTIDALDNAQVSILTPTEVLSKQHYTKLLDQYSQWQGKSLTSMPLMILQAGRTTLINNYKITAKKFEEFMEADAEKKKLILHKLGATDKEIELINFTKYIWTGTHALLFNKNIKSDLVLVDEQHRFGVKQRAELAKVGAHFVSFTATPIPRTLALSIYQDLKPYFIEKIASRNNIETLAITDEELETKLIPEMTEHLKKGNKIYIVCPLIDENEEMKVQWSVAKAKQYFESKFSSKVLSTSGREKDKSITLQKYKEDKDHQILISTTVIEVGVDVPEATLMVIMNAERFGLSALHQIRGRVGRNDLDYNKCILVTPKEFSRIKRIGYLVKSNDGFELAEKDLELRGMGQLFGKVQSGYSSEIDELIGLDINMYKEINGLVSQTDYNDPSLARLKKYLELESQKIWEE